MANRLPLLQRHRQITTLFDAVQYRPPRDSAAFFLLFLWFAAAGRRHLFTFHSSLLPFLLTRHRLAVLSEMHPPPLLLAEKKRSAVHGVGEEEALVQTKMDPCFYKTVLYYVASMA